MAYENKSFHDALMEAGDNARKGLAKYKRKAEDKK